jgi:hypothetical protein
MRTNIKLQTSEGDTPMCCVPSRMLLTYTAVGVQSDDAHKRNIIRNKARQHSYFITQSNYKGYMFRLLISHLQVYFVNSVTRCYMHTLCISVNVNTMGSLFVLNILLLN